ncbi:MAG: hypothetical protein M3Q89_00030 [Verrucomicrobiota bacterium]|nr:hypothetical protein [Verrucomicrobiota bacterium]
MLDVSENCRAQKYTPDVMARRICWVLLRPLFRFSPRPCFGWRSFLLRMLGAQIGRDVHIYSSATIYYSRRGFGKALSLGRAVGGSATRLYGA